MPRLTRSRAAWIAGAAAVAVFLPALWNGFAGDDLVAVRDNPAAHSVGAALRAWFEPYWPGEWRWAGLYRPVTILSYGLDWSLAGGATWWLHLVNVLLHAVVTAMVVGVLAAWLPPVATLVGGLLFAVHPVHVEAVANIVGRAELLVAIGLLGAVLAARRYRRAASSKARSAWLAVVLLAVLGSMFAKEHGVIALGVLALDHVFDRERGSGSTTGLYVAVLAVTLGWLHLWRQIAGGYVAVGAHAAFFELTWAQRLATMSPLYLDVLRLLVWPFRLLSDYAPQTVPVRTALGWVSALGLIAASAAALLGVLARRRAPAVAFGMLLAVLSYLPTSNLVFVSGVMLAERNLYLAVLAPAALAGWVIVWLNGKERRAVGIGLAALLTAFAVRTVDRTPIWSDPLTLVLEEQVAHPDNFHNRILLGEFLWGRGDRAWALGELLVAGDLFTREPWPQVLASRRALEMGRPLLALRQAESAYLRHQDDPRVPEALVRALLANGLTDSAVAVGSAAASRLRSSAEMLRAYGDALREAGAEDRIALVSVRLDWLAGRLVDVQRRLDSLADVQVPGSGPVVTCEDLDGVRAIVAALRPDLWGPLRGESDCAEQNVTRVSS